MHNLIPALILLGALLAAWHTDSKTHNIDAAMIRFGTIAAIALIAAALLTPS